MHMHVLSLALRIGALVKVLNTNGRVIVRQPYLKADLLGRQGGGDLSGRCCGFPIGCPASQAVVKHAYDWFLACLGHARRAAPGSIVR